MARRSSVQPLRVEVTALEHALCAETGFCEALPPLEALHASRAAGVHGGAGPGSRRSVPAELVPAVELVYRADLHFYGGAGDRDLWDFYR